jgi:imidazolonepropionase-like amidohydrolase
VIPGLIDSHVHMATPPNAKRAQANLRRNLYAGVTAVRDMADDLRSVGELTREARAGEIPSPDIYYAAVMAGPEFFADPRVGAASFGMAPGKSPWMQAIDEKTDLREAVTLARGTSATALKVYADLPPDLVKAITEEAHRQHILVWAHSAVFPTRPADVIAAGVDVVSHACYQAYQLEPVMLKSYEDHTPFHDALLAQNGDDPVMAGLYRDMLKHGTILDATGSLFVRYDAERKAHPERHPLRCTGPTTIRLVRQAWQAGVPISTGTDNDPGVDDKWPSVFDEIFFLAHDVGMPPLQVIHSATLVGAQAAGQAHDMGSIEAGKLANFAVLSADPVKDIGNIRSIRMTVKRGHVYPRADYRPVTKEEMGNDDD